MATMTFAGPILAALNELKACMEGLCFVAGTPVWVAEQDVQGVWHLHSKPIETIKAGEYVVARNETSGKSSYKKVLRTTLKHAEVVVSVTLADAKTGQIVETITSSHEHPFYVEGKGFVPAGGLAIGNSIVTRAGPVLVVKSIEWQRRVEGYTVYNFEVEDDHSYFVGTAYGGDWVHNYDNPPSTPEGGTYILVDPETNQIVRVGRTKNLHTRQLQIDMSIKKVSYQAGDWFVVPLKFGGYVTGRIARTSRGGTVLGYFFSPLLNQLPVVENVQDLTAGDAILVRMFSHLGLTSGKWPILPYRTHWDSAKWPLPAFCHFDLVDSTKAYRREYDERDLNRIIRENEITLEEAKSLYEDGLSGYLALEVHLRRTLIN